ncbi:zf-HC2 domain-containing protein [Chelativorans sp. AA-79]|uniref:anti-sigma factor family protein n=1 Tax=Chelativorans sp. AA-79 TaxID=3028735 RepID=UPI0023F886DD|nr:zf-HC2 domain-containing protein [Chelativorans sp. AA-79]WEX08654.1 zf-HC2 domain-containing protein [Chelativorans sp. AA-79]
MTQDLRCEEVIEKLLEYLDRELDAEMEQALARHMDTCRACFSRAEFERRLRARVREASEVKAPESLRRRVRAMVARF